MEMVRLSALGGAADAERRGFDGVAQPLRHRIGKGDIGVGHHHHEFLAAIAAGQIDAAHIGGDAAGEFLQHLVADVMAMGVVDRLEIIDVHDHESQRLAVLLGVGDQIVQMPAHIAAIVQAGELVGDRHFQAELNIVAQAVGIALLAQLGAHPRHQFVLVHRPGQIVVDAHLQRLGQLAAVAVRHHHQDGHVAAFRQRAQLRAKAQAVEAAHAQADNDQIGIAAPHPHQRFLERIHGGHFMLRRQGRW